MTANSILGMNRTIGERELETNSNLTALEEIQVRLDLANTLDNENQDDFNREMGRGIRAEAISDLINYANTDPAHVAIADPRTAEPVKYGGQKTLQEFADEREKNFNRRYYNNPEGKPEWVR